MEKCAVTTGKNYQYKPCPFPAINNHLCVKHDAESEENAKSIFEEFKHKLVEVRD